MIDWTLLPTPTPAQTALALRCYRTLVSQVMGSQTILLEGVPAEWGAALDDIQKVLTAYKRETTRACTATPEEQADREREQAIAHAVWSAHAVTDADPRQTSLFVEDAAHAQ